MDTSGSRVQYSTGRLTRAQAAAVTAWRERLLDDRPLPGQDPKDSTLRLMGMDDRPPASGSDVLAMIVEDQLAKPPGMLEIASYSEATRAALRRAAESSRGVATDAPVFRPVNFFLPAAVAQSYDELRRAARLHADQAIAEIRTEARTRYPDTKHERVAWAARAHAERGVPPRVGTVPGGVLARIGIDRWAAVDVDEAIAAAVAYAPAAHAQPHRARTDMHKLRRYT